jgi:hypothetical protein
MTKRMVYLYSVDGNHTHEGDRKMFNSQLIKQKAPAYTALMTNPPARNNHKQEALNMKPLQSETIIWQCGSCQAWWGNGNHVHVAAALMRYAAGATTSLAWNNYRGWRSNTDDPITCPQCGQLGSPFLQTRPILQPAKLSHYQFYREAA